MAQQGLGTQHSSHQNCYMFILRLESCQNIFKKIVHFGTGLIRIHIAILKEGTFDSIGSNSEVTNDINFICVFCVLCVLCVFCVFVCFVC